MTPRTLNDIKSVINDPLSVKVLASVDRNGMVHAVFKESITADEDGNIYFFELNETSQTNKNMTYSLWFKRSVSVNILTRDKKSYQIKGVPVRVVICGLEFEKAYVTVRERLGDGADLSAIWVIQPDEIREETPLVRRAEEREKYPLIGHLDRFLPAKAAQD
jgi:hypothetical protein